MNEHDSDVKHEIPWMQNRDEERTTIKRESKHE